MSKYSGECYCGAVKFYCDGDPFFTQYCHCNKCREVITQSKHDADKQGYAWTAGYLTLNFHITSGIDNLDEIIRNNAKPCGEFPTNWPPKIRILGCNGYSYK